MLPSLSPLHSKGGEEEDCFPLFFFLLVVQIAYSWFEGSLLPIVVVSIRIVF